MPSVGRLPVGGILAKHWYELAADRKQANTPRLHNASAQLRAKEVSSLGTPHKEGTENQSSHSLSGAWGGGIGGLPVSEVRA